MTTLTAERATLEQLVPLVPELVAGLLALSLVVWLAWRILVVLDRELERHRATKSTQSQLVELARDMTTPDSNTPHRMEPDDG